LPKYVALLRGINVGRNKRVTMEDLREILGRLGHVDVKTYLNSGNVIFTSRREHAHELASEIEHALDDTLGMFVRCVIRTDAELSAVIEGNTLIDATTDGSRMLALFLSEQPDAAMLTAHDPTALAADHIRVGERMVYQWCPDGILAAPNVSAFLEKHWKVVVTARNWNTVTKLAAALMQQA
jgi:uncharacterized protein (DUF1697 family)